jgi:hypothetical protein
VSVIKGEYDGDDEMMSRSEEHQEEIGMKSLN